MDFEAPGLAWTSHLGKPLSEEQRGRLEIFHRLLGAKFPVPALLRVEFDPSFYEMDRNPWEPGRPSYHLPPSCLSIAALADKAAAGLPVMWHPLGQIEWLQDPFEPLLVESITEPRHGSGKVVTVRGLLSGGTHRRQVLSSGIHHEDALPQFSEVVKANLEEWRGYYIKLLEQLRIRLMSLGKKGAALQAAGEQRITHWKGSASFKRAHPGFKENPGQVPEKKVEEKKMGVFELLKKDLATHGERGAKVAFGCAAADIVVKHMRKLIGKHYPKFFTQSPVGKALEPVVLCSTVLAIGYAVQSNGGTKLPLHDTVMNYTRYALEGKIRDAVATLVGPITGLFTRLGTELAQLQPE